MIKNFKDFDAKAYLKSRVLNEAIDKEDENIEYREITESEVITGEPVYSNKFLTKISRIILKKIQSAGIGDFAVYHDIVYLNGMPGVWLSGLDNNKINIVFCRNVNVKILALFNEFDINQKNKAVKTYSTNKFGYVDMFKEMLAELDDSRDISESVEMINEAGGYGAGYSLTNINNFKKLDIKQKDKLYELVKTTPKSAAIAMWHADVLNGDSEVIGIMTTYLAGKKITSGPGQSKYIVSLAYDVVNKTYPADPAFKELIDEYDKYYGSGTSSPAISTVAGTVYEATETEAEKAIVLKRIEAEKRDEIKNDTIKYEKTLRKLRLMTNAMCHYVKQNGDIDVEDQSVLVKRGLLLTGKGGIGKSYTVEKVIKENDMVKNRDYVYVGSGSTTAESIYYNLYNYNGKLIIFDDSPDLFSTPKKIAVWKAALQSDGTESVVSYPLDAKRDNSNLYKMGRLEDDPQKRYFEEMGRKSTEEKTDFKNKRYKELKAEWGVKYDRLAADSVIEQEWKEIEDNTSPKIPDQFVFNGVIIVIGNDTRDELKKQTGEGHWSAIVDRFKDYDLSPMSASIWEVIKKQIISELEDPSIGEPYKLIPSDIAEEFIKKVDELIVEPQYQVMTWRLVKQYGKQLRGKLGREDWEEDLKNDMYTNK